jgi:hypothetical protein
MNYDLSIIVAGIRTGAWNGLYASIEKATKKSFEVIFIGPTFPPVELQNLPNIKFVRDFGSPTRCKQIGLQLVTGTHTTFASDDAPFLEGAIDSMFGILSGMDSSEKNVVTGKYYEGRQIPGSDELHLSDKYYYLSFHSPTQSPHNSADWFIFNMGLINTSYLKSLGGWDCAFEVDAMAHADLAVRMQRDDAVVKLTPECVSTIEWSPGTEGDHGPVHHACVDHDFPLFQSIYANPDCVNRVKVPIDNWTFSSSCWSRRFK